MKAVVAAFNQEKALVWGLLRDYEPSDAIRMELFEALVETASLIMTRAGVLAAADPQQRGGLGHGAGQRQDVPQAVPEEQELPQEEVQGTGVHTSIYTVTATVDKAILKTACQ